MGYLVTNPPVCTKPGFNASVASQWEYRSEDAASLVQVDGYITNAKDLGMKVYDEVKVYDTNASPIVMTTHIVTEINTDGSANLTAAGATSGTDSD